jgi:hypothetical protein
MCRILGGHAREILAEMGYGDGVIEKLSASELLCAIGLKLSRVAPTNYKQFSHFIRVKIG